MLSKEDYRLTKAAAAIREHIRPRNTVDLEWSVHTLFPTESMYRSVKVKHYAYYLILDLHFEIFKQIIY
jgi:hypothetical protein